MGETQVRDAAREPRQQAAVHDHRASAPAWPVAARRLPWPSLATTSRRSATRTARAAPTASRPRAASTPRRTTATTATASTGCSTTPSRAATSAPARRTSTAWPRSPATSSTSAWPRASRSRGSTAACWTPARSAGRRSRGRSTRGARPASSCCSARTRRSSGRSGSARSRCTPRHEMLELIVVDDRAVGIVTRDMVTGEIEAHLGDAVVMATGGYGNVFYLSTMAKGCNATAIWRAHRKGAAFANPCYTQIHPTCIPVAGEYQSKLTLMSESLRNDGRVWVPKTPGDTRAPDQIPESERDYYLERKYPVVRQPGPARHLVARGQGGLRRGPGRRAGRPGRLPGLLRGDPAAGRQRDPRAVRQPVRHVQPDHRRGPVQGADADLPGRPLHDGRALGRLQPDEHHPRPVRGRRGELLRPRRQPPRGQRPDAGAGRRLLHPADDRRRLPGARTASPSVTLDHPAVSEAINEVQARTQRLLSINGTPDGGLVPPRARAGSCGSTAAWPAPMPASARRSSGSRELREQFWQDVRVPGEGGELNQELEKAGRVADFLELGELICIDALASDRVVRRALPRGEPDRGRRGAPRRRELLVRGGLDSPATAQHAEAGQGAAGVREHPPGAAKLQVIEVRSWVIGYEWDATSSPVTLTPDHP